MKQKFKNYGFIMGVAVAVIGALVAIGNVVGFKVDDVAITSIFTAVLGVFVALGLVEKPEEEQTDKPQEVVAEVDEQVDLILEPEQQIKNNKDTKSNENNQIN